MRHYSTEDLLQIKNYIADKKNLINHSVSWVNDNLKYEDKNDVLLQLKSAVNTLNKISSNIDSKPVIAVFGASQVGKSYLIKSLLSSSGHPFVIKNQDREYDFLKDINPPGTGAESTGVVTRFTIDNAVKFQDFPIKIKILSPKDILIIILDSFFLDLKKISTFVNRNELEIHLKRFEITKTEIKQKFLNEYDILEIKEYFENHLSKHTILFEGIKETRFFERISRIVEYFDFTVWSDIFSVLWNRNEDLSALFNNLIRNLDTLGYDSVGYLQFENVLRTGGAILDVENLKVLNQSSVETVFKKENGDEVKINTAYLSSLISELIFSIPDDLVNCKEFLKNSDLLDFPGARTRLGIEADGIQRNIPQMLLRGKVSYLFNKYTDDYSINNLLFCTNDAQLNINELSYLLFNWISKNIGENADERTKSLGSLTVPPLFVIFTFINNQLRFDTTNDEGFLGSPEKLQNKWENRFVRFFENEIVTKSRDWHVNWSHVSPKFKNFYLLRDFKYSTDTYDGFETTGKETNLREERSDFIMSMKHSFTNYDFVKNHFDNPSDSWENSTGLNKDGSEMIIQNLIPVSNNIAKINHYLNLLNSIIIDLKIELVKFIHSDDVSALRIKNMRTVTDFQFQFNTALSRNFNLFNEFIEILSIQPVDIFNLLNEKIVMDTATEENYEVNSASILLTSYPELKTSTSYQSSLEILKDRFALPTIELVEEFLSSHGVKKEDLFKLPKNTNTKSQAYTELVINNWLEKIENQGNFQHFSEKGITKNNIEFITDHFKTILNKRDIRNKLVMILNDVVSEIDINHGNEAFLAETFSLIINDIVYNLDINYISEEEKMEIRTINANNSNSYFERKPMTDPATISQLFDNSNLDVQSIALQKYIRWIEFLKTSLLINSGFVTYDETANENLKKLSSQYCEFQLN
ncbi:virulence factor SrfC family protein [Frigoriflavimonas asaccharolytica]|uniref:Virulence factor n=1 Tax=Frigoriflavimonas asaccharolytica TaxID=2735899 RepID=A0A8J8G938_9FLAO|nr:virulence factor SrfC family protein [Frigoriflavimonas asaccharolytica]NRS93581.1 hypothetical protein [Frigoriflavimonas asaccharolytica]